MRKVVSLFSSQAEAEKAIDALNTKSWDELETNVVESAEDEVVVTPAPAATTAGNLQGVPTAMPFDLGSEPDLNLNMEEAEFFRRGIKKGGVLVIANVDESHAETAVRLMQENGGQTAQK